MPEGNRRRWWRRASPTPRTGGPVVLAATLGVALMAGPAHAAPPVVESTVASVRAIAMTRGRVEHHELALHGIPLRGAYETVRIRPDGTTAVLFARHPVAEPQLRPSEARIDAAQIPGRLAALRGVAEAPPLEGPPELVYLMILDQPVLAWEVQQALTMRPEPSRITVWMSAATGRVLEEAEQVRSSHARVFGQNPSATPEPDVVELLDIDVEDAGHPLVGTRVQAFNCVGEAPEDEADVSPWWDEGECWPLQTVFSDDAGDYFVPLPDVVLVEDNIAGSDPYAELSMYVHAELFLEAMRSKGIEQYQCEFSTMLANSRDLEPSGELDYTPLNNAYYTDQCDPEKGPTMIFGQGTEVDFGYDADVIYHELGHGMVALLAPEGLSRRRTRPHSSVVDAGGINEALADYFSIMLTDDPELAEYVGRFWSGVGRSFIRDAENRNTCPADTIGQVHNDGEPFMAALWATRKRLDADGKEALDQAVIEALMRMPRDVDLEEASALVLEMAQAEVSVGTLSSDEWDLLHRSFESRGLLDCPRVLEDPALVAEGHTLFLRRFDDGVYPFYPGPLQLRYEVPEGADDLVLSYTLRPRSGDEPVSTQVLVKRGDAPIEFEYQLVAVDDPPLEPPEDDAEPEDPVRELVLVTGDWDLERSAIEVAEDDYVMELGGLEPGEVLYVTIVNLARDESIATETKIRSSTELPDDDAATGTSGDSGDPPGFDVVTPGAGSSGCACRGSGDGGPSIPLAGLVVLAVGLGRRRWRAHG